MECVTLWTVDAHTELAYVSQDTVTAQTPDAVTLPNDSGRLEAFVPYLQREDGSYVGIDTTSPSFGYSNVVAVNSGGTLWKKAVASPPLFLTPIFATTGNGVVVTSTVIAQNGTLQLGRLYTLDSNGSLIFDSADLGLLYSWSSTWYGLPPRSNIVSLAFPGISLHSGSWPVHQGSPSPKSAAKFITVHFGPGTKSSADHVSFLQPGTHDCTENLGPIDCPSPDDAWHWNVEVQATVPDDVALWTAKQKGSGRQKGFWKDSNGNLHAFDSPISLPHDDPDPRATQQPAGAKTMFWIDGPGNFKSLGAGQPIDSMIEVINFTSRICSKSKPQNCASVNWFIKLVIIRGAQLDTVKSKAGLGTVSIQF
jgi:hypothetical protein